MMRQRTRTVPARGATITLCLAVVVLNGTLGCRDDTQSPTEPTTTIPQANVSAAVAITFRQISAGGYHMCGVTDQNRAYCWGANGYGQLGIGATGGQDFCDYQNCSTRPVAVLGGLSFRQIDAGDDHTCGITTDYRAYCWGYGGSGELGNGQSIIRFRPVAVAGGLQFRQVSAGGSRTCAISTNNRAYCWGAGFIGDGTNDTDRSTPGAVSGGLLFRQVSTGGAHTCGVTTQNVAYCWGRNAEGELGDSTEVWERLRPARVAGTRQWRQVDAGGQHSCGVTTAYKAFCWGNGDIGQLGNGKTYVSFWPRAVSGGLSFARVTAGGGHNCGETTTNRAYCWGANYSGQLGDGTRTRRLTPAAVSGGIFFNQVSGGGSHTCGKTSAAVTYCWGENFGGQLGDGTRITRLRPTRILGTM
jgi:alpha-tubulin suppressor-like RCC1 family protein